MFLFVLTGNKYDDDDDEVSNDHDSTQSNVVRFWFLCCCLDISHYFSSEPKPSLILSRRREGNTLELIISAQFRSHAQPQSTTSGLRRAVTSLVIVVDDVICHLTWTGALIDYCNAGPRWDRDAGCERSAGATVENKQRERDVHFPRGTCTINWT